jgi:hypothetical protein
MLRGRDELGGLNRHVCPVTKLHTLGFRPVGCELQES